MENWKMHGIKTTTKTDEEERGGRGLGKKLCGHSLARGVEEKKKGLHPMVKKSPTWWEKQTKEGKKMPEHGERKGALRKW